MFRRWTDLEGADIDFSKVNLLFRVYRSLILFGAENEVKDSPKALLMRT